MEKAVAVTRIRKVQVRFVEVPPEEAERRRRTLLQLQVRSILNAHRAAERTETGQTTEPQSTEEEHL